MASSCPGTHDLDGEAALDCPAASTPAATTFSFDGTTITLADFAPTHVPHPRPWKRIAVPGAGNRLGLRTVWKRIGGVPRSSADRRYFQSAVELRADGTGSRKTRRTERHVPVWGNAQWQTRDTESVEDELSQAREAVAGLTKKAEVSDTNILGRSLAFIPRKRNSRRQPLTASLPPPTEPATAQSPVRPTTAVDESLETIEQSTEHITKRAKRRMSRRISILPKLEAGSLLLSPEKKTAPSHVFSSPVKRRVSVSMAAIHDPPATPRSPAILPPSTPGTAKSAISARSTPSIAPPIAFEPSFSSPIKTLAPISENLSPAKPASPSPRVKLAMPMSPVVIFDRPAAEEMEAESPQEVRRRISLFNMRRRETLFSTTFERQSPAKATSTSRANRRHSFLPQHTPLVFAPASAKKKANRRHTFQPGGLGISFGSSFDVSFDKTLPDLGNVPSITVSESENTASTIELSTIDESTTNEKQPGTSQDSTVVVDVRTNLDIFGSGPPVQTHHSSPISDKHVSFDLKSHTEKLAKSTPSKSTNDSKTIATTPSPTPKANDLMDAPAGPETAEDPNDQSLDTVTEEDTAEVPNDSTPRSLSPDMDIDTTEEDSREVTDEMGIVSRRRATELDESLLLPLPETESTETDIGNDNDNKMETEAKVEAEADAEIRGADYGWQSPTSAELGQQETVVVAKMDDAVEAPISSPSATKLDIDMDLLVDESDNLDEGEIAKDDELADNIDDVDDQDIEDIEEVEDMEEVEDVGVVEDVFTAPPSIVEEFSDGSSPARSGDEDGGEYTVTQPINMFPGAIDDDATATMTMDFDNLAEDQLSSHSDSETEMLRKFVTRVKADKSAKAAAAAEEATARTLAKVQRKRRSGSTGSTASSSGSPMTRETKKEGSIFASPFTTLEAARVPFGKKDHNMSPSPRKKRRALTGMSSDGNENRAEDLLSKPSFDDNSPPRPKRRRKKMEADTGGIFNPEFMNAKKEKDEAAAAAAGESDAPGPRRSKRTRSQTPLKTATTAASAPGALSLIPVRLPGSLNLNGDDSYGLSASSLSLRRNDEKDLAATTRVNTRKNKGNADPPCIVVARQSHEALRAVREQKSVFDSPLVPQKTAGRDKADKADNNEDGKSRKTKKSSKPAKSVRWAEVLARFQTDAGEASEKAVTVTSPVETSPEAEIASNSSSSSLRAAEQQLPVETMGVLDSAPTSASSVSSAPLPTSVPSAAAPPSQSSDSSDKPDKTDKTSIPRRTTRVSRLQPPTPRKVIASAAAAKAAAAPPPPPAEPAPMGLKAQPAGGRMATRRAKIVGMGMAGNGTPAPKRRTTRTT